MTFAVRILKAGPDGVLKAVHGDCAQIETDVPPSRVSFGRDQGLQHVVVAQGQVYTGSVK